MFTLEKEKGRNMRPEQRKHILHRRWAIVLIIIAILATLLHAWFLVLMFVVAFVIYPLALKLIVYILGWIAGDDLGPDQRPNKINPNASDQRNDVSDTMWDIYTTDQIIKHNPYNNDNNFHDNDNHN